MKQETFEDSLMILIVNGGTVIDRYEVKKDLPKKFSQARVCVECDETFWNLDSCPSCCSSAWFYPYKTLMNKGGQNE